MSKNKKLNKRDLFEDIEFYGVEGHVPFALGGPGPSTMAGCRDIMIKATEAAMSDMSEERYIFQYGPRQGDPGFIEQLAKFLTDEYGSPVDSDNLMVTAGATQGLYITTSVLFSHNSPVFVEDPTYFIAINVLQKDLGRTVISVPVGDDGVDLAAFEELLKEHRPKAGDKSTWLCPYWTMLYCMTVYNNPKGNCVSPEKCKQLIELARKYDVLIFTEDIYNLIHFGEGKPPPRLLSYDTSDDPDYKGCVLSNGTFSKIFAPGMRLGWLEGKEALLDHFLASYIALSGGSFNHYTSRVMSSALELRLMSKHLRKLCTVYGDRVNVMCEALTKILPPGSSFKKPMGGFFVWITLPDKIDAAELLELANSKYNINFIAGQSTSPTGSFKNCIRLAISYCEKDQIEDGVKKLGCAIQEYLSSK